MADYSDHLHFARRQRLHETRAAIKEIESILRPLQSVVFNAESKLRVLRQTEAHYMAALGEANQEVPGQ